MTAARRVRRLAPSAMQEHPWVESIGIATANVRRAVWRKPRAAQARPGRDQQTRGYIVPVSLSLTFLGTSASRPTVERSVSAIAVVREGETFLFDCG